jgi:hypothetical protein
MITRTRAGVAIGVAVVALVGCGGGSPSSPSGQSPNRLQGVWNGILTIVLDGQPSVDGATRWTFTGSGAAYRVAIQSSNPSLPLTTDQVPAADTALSSATGLPVDLVTLGSYPCSSGVPAAVFASAGQVTSETTITATFHGVDCTRTPYNGSVRLTLSR